MTPLEDFVKKTKGTRLLSNGGAELERAVVFAEGSQARRHRNYSGSTGDADDVRFATRARRGLGGRRQKPGEGGGAGIERNEQPKRVRALMTRQPRVSKANA